jgi:hypothetical protein
VQVSWPVAESLTGQHLLAKNTTNCSEQIFEKSASIVDLCSVLIDMLCETCQTIFKGLLGPGEQKSNNIHYQDHDHHRQLLQLHNSVLEGCFICDILFHYLASLWTESTSHHIPGKYYISRDIGDNRLDLWFTYELRKAPQEDIQAMQEISGRKQEDIHAMQEVSGREQEYAHLKFGSILKGFHLRPTRGITHPALSRILAIIILITNRLHKLP